MNYAEDRRDRRARNCNNGGDHRLASEYLQSRGDHAARATTVRDVGWNRAALYHYGVAWCRRPSSAQAAGDYAAMADLAGFPELGMVAVLVYRLLLLQQQQQQRMTWAAAADQDQTSFQELHLLMRLEEIPHADCWADPVDLSVLLDGVSNNNNWSSRSSNCGCGQAGCGNGATWMIPMTEAAINTVRHSLEDFACNRVAGLHYRLQRERQCQRQQQSASSSSSSITIPTAHQLIQRLLKGAGAGGALDDDDVLLRHTNLEPAIPTLLQFWRRTEDEDDDDDDDDASAALPPELQLLLIKLLFQVLPSLAIEAVVGLRFLDNGDDDDDDYDDDDEDDDSTLLAQQQQQRCRYSKSHRAYYMFVKALVLGVRIKPHRRRRQRYYHVPLWDRLWGLDDAADDDDNDGSDNNNNSSNQTSSVVDQQHAKLFATNLCRFLKGLRNGSNNDVSGAGSLVWIPPFRSAACCSEPVFLVGDLHVFSLAWNTVQFPDNCSRGRRLVVPVVVTGLKAWHVRRGTRFFTRSSLETTLQRLDDNCRTILFSAGEIDCREGLGGPLLEGYTRACHEHVVHTVREYVQALGEIVRDDRNKVAQILVLPVAPHLYRTKRGRSDAQASRRETMRVWNVELRRQILRQRHHPNNNNNNNIYLLDYADHLQAEEHPDAFALNPAFNADSTHMNSAFIPVLERAIRECGCNIY